MCTILILSFALKLCVKSKIMTPASKTNAKLEVLHEIKKDYKNNSKKLIDISENLLKQNEDFCENYIGELDNTLEENFNDQKEMEILAYEFQKKFKEFKKIN